jgi:hypothetical protein
MHCGVVPLFDFQGVRRSEADLRNRHPVYGELSIEHVAGKPGRPSYRVAKLRAERRSREQPYFGDLYNPQIVEADRQGFVLSGYAKYAAGEEKRAGFVLQAWRVMVNVF